MIKRNAALSEHLLSTRQSQYCSEPTKTPSQKRDEFEENGREIDADIAFTSQYMTINW